MAASASVRIPSGHVRRTAILAALLTIAVVCATRAADAASLQLTGGVWQTTPAQVVGDVTRGNDVLTSPVGFFDNATITAIDPMFLTFYYVGAESGFNNTLTVAGAGSHTDNNSYPGSWSNPALFTIQLGAGQSVPMSFSFDGPNSPVAPGGGVAVGDPANGNFNRSIGFSVLSCTTGNPACFAIDPALRSGSVIAFMLDDGGANEDNNHDDYVGFMVATPVPLPAAAWLLCSGLLGLAGLRRRA